MPLRAARVGRVGVIGHPVAKTAVVAKAVSPGPSPVAKTAVVAAAVTPGRYRPTADLDTDRVDRRERTNHVEEWFGKGRSGRQPI